LSGEGLGAARIRGADLKAAYRLLAYVDVAFAEISRRSAPYTVHVVEVCEINAPRGVDPIH